jgi:hypothetical protein
MTIFESIEVLKQFLKKDNAITVIEQVTNILTDIYFSSNDQARMSLKYVPLNNARIQLLIEIMEQLYQIEERNQVADKNIAIIISSLD